MRKVPFTKKLLSCVTAVAMALALSPAAPVLAQAEGNASLQAQATTQSSKPTLVVKRASTGKLVLKKGTSYKLGATSSGAKLTYSSSKKKVAKVSSTGKVTAKKTGTTTITIKAKKSGKTTTKKVKVKVVKASAYKKVKSITASLKQAVVPAGVKQYISVSAKPKKASNTNVTYKSSNTSIATVSSTGVVTAKKAGTATITVTSCANSKAKARAKITVLSPTSQLTDEATVTCATDVATGASSAVLAIGTSSKLASTLKASNIELSGMLKNFSIKSVNRTGDYSCNVAIQATSAMPTGSLENGDYGYVSFLEGAFEDAKAAGTAPVVIDDPDATIDTNSDLLVYDSSSDVLKVPVNLDTAQVTSKLSAADVSLPAAKNNNVRVYNVESQVGSNQVVVWLICPNSKLADSIETVDTVLTEGGIQVDGSKLNSGNVVATSSAVETGKDLNYSTTALGSYDPCIVSWCEAKDWKSNADGSMSVTVAFTFFDMNSLNFVKIPNSIPSGAIEFASSAEDDDYTAFSNVKAMRRASSSDVEVEMDFDIAADFVDYYKLAEDGSASADELSENRLQFLSYEMGIHSISLNNGIVKNELGIPLSSAEATLFTSEEYVNSSSDSTNTEGGLSATTLNAMADIDDSDKPADGEPGVDWIKTFNTAKTIFTKISGYISNFEKGDWMGLLQSSISDINGYFFTTDAPDKVDLVKEVLEMNDKVTAIGQQVEALSSKLDSIESRIVFKSRVTELNKALSHTEMYATILSGSQKSLMESAEKSGELTVDSTLTADQIKIVEDTVKVAQDMEATRHTNGALEETIALGNLITGNGTSTSIIQEYADYVGTYYNWQPETFQAVDLFYSRVAAAYQCGYSIANMQLKLEMRDAEQDLAAATTNKEKRNAENAIKLVNYELKDLYESAKSVCATLVGTVDDNGNVTEESAISKLTHDAVGDGSVLNLVTGTRFAANSFDKSYFGETTGSQCHKKLAREAKQVGNISLGTSALKISDVRIMIQRLKDNGLYNNLYTELQAQNLAPKKLTWKWETISDIKVSGTKNWDDGQWYDAVFVNEVCKECVEKVKWAYGEGKAYEVKLGGANDDALRKADTMVLLSDAKKKTVRSLAVDNEEIYEWNGATVDLATNTVNEKDTVLKCVRNMWFHGWLWNHHQAASYTMYCCHVAR